MSLNIRLAALLVLVGALFSMPTVATAQATVDVTLGPGFIISAAPSSVDGGSTVFSATNPDLIPHNLRVIKTDLAPESLPISGSTVDEAQVNVVASTADLSAGGSEDTAAVTLEAGAYVLICNVPNHYQNEQRVAFQVDVPQPAPRWDVDEDGFVSILDIGIVVAHFGEEN